MNIFSFSAKKNNKSFQKIFKVEFSKNPTKPGMFIKELITGYLLHLTLKKSDDQKKSCIVFWEKIVNPAFFLKKKSRKAKKLKKQPPFFKHASEKVFILWL